MLDFEVDSPTDLKEHGSARSIADGKPTYVSMGWAGSNAVVSMKWDANAMGWLQEAMTKCDAVVAHNLAYDAQVMKHHAPAAFKELRKKRLSCTICMAAKLNLPRSLKKLGEYLGCKERKLDFNLSDNGDLFNQHTEEEWLEYVGQDVKALAEIYGKIHERISEQEKQLIDLHLRMQLRGLRMDLDMASEILERHKDIVSKLDAKFVSLTGLRPQQSIKVGKWFEERIGVKTGSYKKLDQQFSEEWPDEAKRAFKLLEKRARNEIAKLEKLAKYEVNGRYHDFLLHADTVTNRWKGYGVQLHSCSREGRFRSLVQADEGTRFIVADLSQIEPRIVLWVGGMMDAMKDLHESDWYMNLAQDIYGSDHDEKRMTELRRRVKQGVIGVTYSAGVESVRKGIQGTREEAVQLLSAVKPKLKQITETSTALWSAWQSVAAGVKDKQAVMIGGGIQQVMFTRSAKFQNTIGMKLPTGSMICYRNLVRQPEGDWEYGVGNKPNYMKHPGTLYEHVCSATARDILARAMLKIYNRPLLFPVLSVHDEVIVEDRTGEDAALEMVRDDMTEPHPKLPGLLIATKAEFRSRWKEAT